MTRPDSKWLIPALIGINGVPYLFLLFRLVRILIHEGGASENPYPDYPGAADPIGPEFAFPMFLLSLGLSIMPILLSHFKLRIKALLLLAVVVFHIVGYTAFIVFAFAGAAVVTGRST